MSFGLLRKAMPITSLESLEKLVLLVLCDCYNDRTGQCNPSRELIKNRTGIKNNSTLTKKIASLERQGFIKVQRSYGVLNSYSINLEELPPSSELNHVQNRTTFSNEPSSKVNLPPGSNMNLPPSSELNHVPGSNLNHKPISEPIKEPISEPILINNKQDSSNNSPKNNQPTFELTAEPEPKTKTKKPKAITFKFNFKELPDSWRKYCEERRPDIDPLQLFVDFEFYYTQCEGKDKYYSEKGWAQCWQGWVRRNFQQRPNQFLKNTSYRAAGTASNGAPIKYDKNGIRQSGFDAAYYAEDDEDV